MKRGTIGRRGWTVLKSGKTGCLWWALGLAVCLAGGCRRNAVKEESFSVMGTMASVMAGCSDAERCGVYARRVQSRMKEIESALSVYNPGSDLSRMNAQAGKGLVPAEGHLKMTVGLSLVFGAMTHGAFDVTVGPLVKGWGFSGGEKPERLPSPVMIEERRALVGYTNLVLSGGKCGLTGKGMLADMGGVAKGYAVDVCSRDLKQEGATDFVVNLGGNMRCFGKPQAGRSWRVGVRDPLKPSGTIGWLELGDGMAVATSGNYERFVEIDGKRYAHIIDPRTGWPVQGMAGVTVVAPSAATADALSTGLFVLGPEEGMQVLTLFTNCAALFVPDKTEREILVTPGMEKYFHVDSAFSAQVQRIGRQTH